MKWWLSCKRLPRSSPLLQRRGTISSGRSGRVPPTSGSSRSSRSSGRSEPVPPTEIMFVEPRIDTDSSFSEPDFTQTELSTTHSGQIVYMWRNAEIKKPDRERLTAGRTEVLPLLAGSDLSSIEQALLTFSLQDSLDQLSPNDPWIKTVLNGRTPAQVAAEVIGRN